MTSHQIRYEDSRGNLSHPLVNVEVTTEQWPDIDKKWKAHAALVDAARDLLNVINDPNSTEVGVEEASDALREPLHTLTTTRVTPFAFYERDWNLHDELTAIATAAHDYVRQEAADDPTVIEPDCALHDLATALNNTHMPRYHITEQQDGDTR